MASSAVHPCFEGRTAFALNSSCLKAIWEFIMGFSVQLHFKAISLVYHCVDVCALQCQNATEMSLLFVFITQPENLKALYVLGKFFVRSHVRYLMKSWDFFNWPNPSSRTMALGSTQPLTEMNTRNLPGCKERMVHKADNLTTICEPII
jgi:hypothetical protein